MQVEWRQLGPLGLNMPGVVLGDLGSRNLRTTEDVRLALRASLERQEVGSITPIFAFDYQEQSDRPVPSLTTLLNRINSTVEKDTVYQVIKPLFYGFSWCRESERRNPHFAYGIEYPAQVSLETWSKRWRALDNYYCWSEYHETISQPRIYPLEELSDDSDEDNPAKRRRKLKESAKNEKSSELRLTTSGSQYTEISECKPTDETYDPTSPTIPENEYKTMKDMFYSMVGPDALKYESGHRINNALKAFVETAPFAQEFGEMKNCDMSNLTAQDISLYLLNEVDRERRCVLCDVVNFSLISSKSERGARQSLRQMKKPLVAIDPCGDEITSFLPSFNRMVLNCQERACAQCSLMSKTIVMGLGWSLILDGDVFDKEMLIPCYLSVPKGSTRLYLELMAEETSKSVQEPLLAPEIRLRPPYRGTEHLDGKVPYELPVLIEELSLPLERMQGSGKLIGQHGVDALQVKAWWAQCQTTHNESCQVPTNERYLGREASGYVLRLVDLALGRVVVASKGSAYVALSYVWPKTTDTFKAQAEHFRSPDMTANTLPIRDEQTAYLDIPFEKLPKTILDALSAMRMLDERYIWIDALCIIQDDFIDVQRTIYRMDEIYKGAMLTIVMGDQEATEGEQTFHQFSQMVGDTTYIVPLPSMTPVLEASVWHTRGWTYQEWVFSRCKLAFVGGRVYYACSHSSFQEDRVEGPYKSSDTEPFEDIYGFPHQNTYCRHVEEYSSRNLTNGADILSGFQGILHSMEPQLHTEFCWGLPLSFFDGALLWSGAEHLKRRTEKAKIREDLNDACFPSWSWAGWKGRVKFRPNFHSDNRRQMCSGESAVNRLGHITSLITWPWHIGFSLPPNGPNLDCIVKELLYSGVIRFVTSFARLKIQRLRRLFARQEIDGWTLDDGTVVSSGWRTCIVLSEVENPYIIGKGGPIGGKSPMITYNVMVIAEREKDVFERKGIVKITRKIWEACNPEIRWITLV